MITILLPVSRTEIVFLWIYIIRVNQDLGFDSFYRREAPSEKIDIGKGIIFDILGLNVFWTPTSLEDSLSASLVWTETNFLVSLKDAFPILWTGHPPIITTKFYVLILNIPTNNIIRRLCE